MVVKQHFGGKRLENEEQLTVELENWLNNLEEDWFDSGLKKLLPRYQKCLDINGDYVGK